jgi:transcriptional regulator with XRE-family HTH domain
MGIEHVNLGEILNALRVYKGMSAEEVAQGICSPEDLLQFEKNKKYPAIDQLYNIASKLNVELIQFFDFAAAGSYNYVTAVFDLVKKYKRERNYTAIYEIVNREKINPLFNLPSSRQFLLWHEAVCLYYLGEAGNRKKKQAVQMLHEALRLTNPARKGLTEREVEILIAIALIEKDDQQYETAISFLREALDALEELPVVSDSRVWLRALFGISQSLSNLGRFEESLIYSNKGISQCINDEMMYLFGEFYYQSGLNYIEIGNLQKGKDFWEKSIQAFTLQNNEKFVNLVSSELEKLINQ